MSTTPLRDTWRRAPAGLREAALLLGVYTVYTIIRMFADDALQPAQEHARALLQLERWLRLDWEMAASHWVAEHGTVGLIASYWYAASFYVVTPLVIMWAFVRHRSVYYPMRMALLVATLVALAAYLTLPMAPPRFTGDYPDVVALHAGSGWWAQSSSSPKGLDGMANQLAAFPSMHVGWAVWVAIVVSACGAAWWARALGWAYALGTSAVVVGTGNHWVLDAVAGAALTVAVIALLDARSPVALEADDELAVPSPRGPQDEHSPG
jgi:hypothetical protein